MLEIEVNSQSVLSVLQEVAKRTQQRQPLMSKLAGTMHSAVGQNFQAGGRPKWLGLKYRQGAPLDDSGSLKNSIQASSNNNEAIVGTDQKHAAIHQFGGTITPKIKGFLAFKVGGKWIFTQKPITITARPFMQLTPQDESTLLEDAQHYFQQLLR